MFEKTSKEILAYFSQNRALLRALVLQVLKDPKLFSLCTHYDAVDKIVLSHSDHQEEQLRLHIYSGKAAGASQADISQAHNHRWNFSSLILSGGYQHTIYKAENGILIPEIVRNEEVGNCYTLHHTQYHSIVEKPNTVSLLMRGPREKERFQIANKETGEIQWQEQIPREEKNEKEIGIKQYKALVERLISLKILPAGP